MFRPSATRGEPTFERTHSMPRHLTAPSATGLVATLGLLLAAGAAQAQITTDLRASRVSGVAPLSVFFDALNTTASGVARPYHDLEYHFEFGDPEAGDWGDSNGDAFLSRFSKNEYLGGPMAAHVYEEAGNYTATITVRDENGNEVQDTVQITVSDPDAVFSGANTICYSNTSNFSGCPAGALRKTTSRFSSLAADAQPGMRLLMRRGDSFSGTGVFPATGPGIVGAFGPTTDLPPEVTNGSSGNIMQFGSDWRVMDIKSSVTSSGSARHIGCNQAEVVRQFLTVLRFQGRGGNRIFGCRTEPQGNGRNEYVTVMDSVLEDTKDSSALPYVVYHIAHLGNAFMGNQIGGSGTNAQRGHNMRVPYGDNFVFTFNKFHKPPTINNFRFHGEPGPLVSNYILAGYNTWGPTADRGFKFGPVSASFTDPVEDVIIEGNFGPYGDREIDIGAVRVSARNNVMRVQSDNQAMFNIFQEGGKAVPVDDVWIYNNTLFWTSSSTAKMVRVKEQNGGRFNGDAAFRNNVLYAPNRSTDAFPTGSQFTASNNAVFTQTSQNPFPVASPGLNIDDYTISSGIGADIQTVFTSGGSSQSGAGSGGSAAAIAAPFLLPANP